MKNWIRSACIAAAVTATGAADAALSITLASGADAAAITATVNGFRTALGTLNPNVAGSFASGRREINWDGVPDVRSAPNNLPADFFNTTSPRGAVFSTPGSGFQVSANAASGTAVEFGNINPSYPSHFGVFSAQRLFTALDSTITDVRFFVPGSTIAATTSGFGAVFTDIDVQGSTTMQFFDASDLLLLTIEVPAHAGNEGMSFLGVRATAGESFGRVRITAGNEALSAASTTNDLVVMDDFIYGEPVAVIPEPSTVALWAAGLALLGGWHRRRIAGTRAASQG